MSKIPHKITRNKVFECIKGYGQKVGELGIRAHRMVFGFRRRSTDNHTTRTAMSVKLLHSHRLVQRRRAFQRSGGVRSGVARHALNKIRDQSRP